MNLLLLPLLSTCCNDRRYIGTRPVYVYSPSTSAFSASFFLVVMIISLAVSLLWLNGAQNVCPSLSDDDADFPSSIEINEICS